MKVNMDAGDIFAIAVFIGVVVLGAATLLGWIMNVVSIARSTEFANPMFILRCIGVIAWPLGAIMGYIS